MFKELTYRTKHIDLVCEFRTTKINYKDYTELDKVKRKNYKTGKLEDVRGLLWCSTIEKVNKFVDRDVNAAINILSCGFILDEARPEILTRRSQVQMRNETGKIIKWKRRRWVLL